MHIGNAVGVDAQLQFQALSNYNENNNASVDLDYGPIYDMVNITRAYDNGGSISETVYDFDLNNTNSNIEAFIENLPSSITLQANVVVNPLGDVTDGNDFIYTHNALKATLDIDIPLAIGMQDLTFRDTLSIASAIEAEADGQLFLQVTNAFPFAATVDAFLVNSDGETVGILLQHEIIDMAAETAEAGVTIPSVSMLEIPVNSAMLVQFNPANRIVLKVSFDTQSLDQPSGLYKNYFMDFRVIADGEIVVSYE
jgi:hypothetical protein